MRHFLQHRTQKKYTLVLLLSFLTSFFTVLSVLTLPISILLLIGSFLLAQRLLTGMTILLLGWLILSMYSGFIAYSGLFLEIDTTFFPEIARTISIVYMALFLLAMGITVYLVTNLRNELSSLMQNSMKEKH